MPDEETPVFPIDDPSSWDNVAATVVFMVRDSLWNIVHGSGPDPKEGDAYDSFAVKGIVDATTGILQAFLSGWATPMGRERTDAEDATMTALLRVCIRATTSEYARLIHERERMVHEGHPNTLANPPWIEH